MMTADDKFRDYVQDEELRTHDCTYSRCAANHYPEQEELLPEAEEHDDIEGMTFGMGLVIAALLVSSLALGGAVVAFVVGFASNL